MAASTSCCDCAFIYLLSITVEIARCASDQRYGYNCRVLVGHDQVTELFFARLIRQNFGYVWGRSNDRMSPRGPLQSVFGAEMRLASSPDIDRQLKAAGIDVMEYDAQWVVIASA